MSAALPEGSCARRLWNAWDKAWNQGEVDALDDVLADDYVRIGMLDGRTHDRTGMKQVIHDLRHSFPDLHTTLDRTVESAEHIAILWRSTGTHRGQYNDVPPTGKRVEASGASFCTLRDGLVVEEVETWNPSDILSTLGIRALRAG